MRLADLVVASAAALCASDEAKATTVRFEQTADVSVVGGVTGVNPGDTLTMRADLNEINRTVAGSTLTIFFDPTDFSFIGGPAEGAFRLDRLSFTNRAGQDIFSAFLDSAPSPNGAKIGGQPVSSYIAVLPKDAALDGVDLSTATVLELLQRFADPDDNALISYLGAAFVEANNPRLTARELSNVTAVPLGGGWLFMITGIAGLGFVSRHGREIEAAVNQRAPAQEPADEGRRGRIVADSRSRGAGPHDRREAGAWRQVGGHGGEAGVAGPSPLDRVA